MRSPELAIVGSLALRESDGRVALTEPEDLDVFAKRVVIRTPRSTIQISIRSTDRATHRDEWFYLSPILAADYVDNEDGATYPPNRNLDPNLLSIKHYGERRLVYRIEGVDREAE